MVRVGSSKTIYMSKIFMFFIAISCSCFTASWVGAQDLRATNFKVEPFDGRRGNKGDYTGAWIRLQGVTINGDRIGRSSVGFEFSGNYPNQPMRNFGFSSERTFTDLPRRAADRTHESLGYRFWVDARSGSQKARQKYQMLNETDKILMKGICGLMSDERFVTNVLSQMTNSRPNSYYDYVDNKYNQYWGNERRKREVLRLANICNRGIGNAGSQKVAFELKSMPSVKPSLCGFELENVQTISNLKSIQRGLAKRSLYSGGIDGKFGKGSCSALEKWAKCENVGSKLLSDGTLSKLTKTNPSARELACYGNRPARTTQPVILSVNSSDNYRSESGQHTIINVEMRNRWGNRAEFKLNGYVTGTKPNGVCLVYGDRNNDNKCFTVYDSNNTIKQTIAKFNKRDKENITDACALIVTQFNKIRQKTENNNSRKLVDQRKSAFTGFAYKCLVAIQSSFPGTRYAAAAVGVGAPTLEGSSTPDQVTSGASCTQSKLQVRFNQNVLKSLDSIHFDC